MTQSNPPKNAAELSAEDRLWLRIAEPEIHRRHLDLAHYTVSVEEEKESVVVILTSADAPAHKSVRGSAGTRPGLEVEISRKELKVVRSHFVR